MDCVFNTLCSVYNYWITIFCNNERSLLFVKQQSQQNFRGPLRVSLEQTLSQFFHRSCNFITNYQDVPLIISVKSNCTQLLDNHPHLFKPLYFPRSPPPYPVWSFVLCCRYPVFSRFYPRVEQSINIRENTEGQCEQLSSEKLVLAFCGLGHVGGSLTFTFKKSLFPNNSSENFTLSNETYI